MSSAKEIQSTEGWFSGGRAFPLWQRTTLFGVAYVFCAVAGNYLSRHGEAFISFWLPAGLYLAALLMSDYSDWPWLAGAALIANFAFDIPDGTKPELICFFFVANTLQAVAGAWLMRRFAAERPTMATLKEFVGLVMFAAVFSAMLGSAISAGALMHLGLSHSFEQSWKELWGSNAMAILLLTPFILTWFSKPKWGEFRSSKKIAEAVLLLLALILYIWFLFFGGHGIMSMDRVWVTPILLWAGLRFGQRGATAVSLLLSLSMVFFTTHYDIGLSVAQVSTGAYIFPMQTILAMASLIALIPAIVIGERNRTLAGLRESEERFKNLSAAAFEGICISDNGRIVDVNNQFLVMFGYRKREEVIGRQIIELVAQESRDSIAERIRDGHETIHGHLLVRKDGSVFPAEAQAKVINEGDRNVRMTALRDITIPKQAEELSRLQMEVLEMIALGKPLRETLETLLRMVEGQSPEIVSSILLLDADGVHIRHGAAPSVPVEYIHAIDGSCIGPRDGSCGTAAFRRESVYVEDIASSPLWVEYKKFALPYGLRACWSTPIFDAQRKVMGTFAIYYREPKLPGENHLHLIKMATHTAAVCIAKHRADEALRESEEKFSKAFQSNPNGICITEMETGRYIEVNESFGRLFGYTREEMIGHSSLEMGIWESADYRERLIQPLRDSGSVHDLQMQTRDRNKQVKILTVSAEIIELGGKRCIVSMLYDITSRVRAETERTEAQSREAQARAEYTFQLIASQEAERTRIAAELHDSLGQNLLLIKNRTQLALLNKKVPADLREQFEGIGSLASQSIAEARQISHDLHPHQLDHLGLTQALAAMIDGAADSSGIVFKHKLDNVDGIFPKVFALNFYRIVQESLNNILKHSHAKNARVKLECDVHEIQLRVEDDGDGFEAGKTGSALSGMGLKNIAERVQMLGGKLKINPRPGKGTRVEVTIPISENA